jgi:hypothetical protein
MFMRAWVAFVGSDKVAVVALGRNAPPDLDVPASPVPPWAATLAAFELPPAGWEMP